MCTITSTPSGAVTSYFSLTLTRPAGGSGFGSGSGAGSSPAGPNHFSKASVEPFQRSPSTGASQPGTVSLSVHCHRDQVFHVPVGQVGADADVYWATHRDVVFKTSSSTVLGSWSLIRWPE